MLVEYQRKANLWLLLGFIIWIIGNVLKGTADSLSVQSYLGYLFFLIGFGLFIYGCINYVIGKGYKWYLGLIGILNLVGLIILTVLPDKNNTPKKNK